MKNINKQHKEELSKLQKMAVWVTDHIGTLEFFAICNALVVTPLIFPKALPIVQFISSAWLQLILLPLILIGQNVQSKHSELRADAIYELDKKIEKLLINKKNKK